MLAVGLLATAVAGFAAYDTAQSRPDRDIARQGTSSRAVQIPIYFVAGIFDNGGIDNQGVATVIHCSNVGTSGVVRARLQIFNVDGDVRADRPFDIKTSATVTLATHAPLAYYADYALATGLVNQGLAKIFANSRNIVCSAMTIDAEHLTPISAVALHMVRFNPIADTQE
jgi:hypothetical protein